MKSFLSRLIYGLNELTKIWYKQGDFSLTPFTRYITDASHFTKKGELKWNAFKQNKKTRDMSVYDVAGLKFLEIKELGIRNVINKKIPKLYGHAVLIGRDFEKNDLAVSYNNIPKRHANIVGWLEQNEDNAGRLALTAKSLLAASKSSKY